MEFMTTNMAFLNTSPVRKDGERVEENAAGLCCSKGKLHKKVLDVIVERGDVGGAPWACGELSMLIKPFVK